MSDQLAGAADKGVDFLLEFRSEEIPARMQAKARENLARLFAAELAKAGLTATETVTYATPRRLALIARGLPDATKAVSEEVKGPKTSAPAQALEGFLRKTGLTREQLVDRNGTLFAITEKPGRATAAVLAEAIPAIIRAFPWPKSMRWGAASLSTESPRWVRPLQGIVALFGEDIVDLEAAGIRSGAATLGHRFHHPGVITVGGAHDYVEKLRACHVIVDQDERAALIRERARALATEAGLELIEDEGLVAENAGLTEWPVPLLGRFDEAFLQVPPEVIQLTARMNQKYFVCRSADGNLANAFICTANIDAPDGGATIVEGNRKVLAARLADARFFYDTDRKVPLEEQARKLEKIIFHEKLGTVADKVERVAKLARWLVEEGIVQSPSRLREGLGEGSATGDVLLSPPPTQFEVGCAPGTSSTARGAVDLELASGRGEPATLADMAERAARLAKADLVTGMVGEFPELQGLMGGYYAVAQGEDLQVAEAIRDHYKPVGQGDEVPTAPVTVAVSLADKLDTIFGFFSIGERPSGSKDPFAIRRAALGAIHLITHNDLRMSFERAVSQSQTDLLAWLFAQTPKWQEHLKINGRVVTPLGLGFRFNPAGGSAWLVAWHGGRVEVPMSAEQAALIGQQGVFIGGAEAAVQAALDFFADRLKVQQREAGVRHDLIDAVFALGGEDDLVRLLARTHALQAFVGTEDGANLLAGYKRAANILKKEGYEAPLPLAGGVGGGVDIPTSAPPADLSGPPPTPPASGRGEEGLSYTPEIAEGALIAALDSAEPAAAQAVAREDFEGAMAALASLRVAVDRFFDEVTVNDADTAKRAARLALLARVRDAVHTVADFSKIEG